MQELQDNKQVFYSWSSYSRCYENRPRSFFKLIVVLGFCFSFLAYFFGDPLLIVVVWALVFVAWVSSVVPPPLVDHKITKFGLQINSLFLPTKSLSAFTVLKKRNCYLLRLFVSAPESEIFVVLPENEELRKKILDHLQNEIPFIEKVPKNEIERFGEFLEKTTGL